MWHKRLTYSQCDGTSRLKVLSYDARLHIFNDAHYSIHQWVSKYVGELFLYVTLHDEIIVKGTIRETALFGHVLEVRRTIRIPAFGASVTVQDTVSNLTPRDEEIMQIYHCNFGYPLLSEKAHLVLPEARETIPRTDFAGTSLGRECEFDKPIDGEEERVFFQKMQREFWARLENPVLGVNMTISWSGDTLPILSQWRSMASGDYVLGLEPANCYIMGRHDERENGTLPVLKAWESITNIVKIEFAEEKENG